MIEASQGSLTQALLYKNLSLAYQQLGDWEAAATVLQQANTDLAGQEISALVQAQLLDVAGKLQFARGDFLVFFFNVKETTEIYTQLGDFERQALSRLHQAQAQQSQGLYQQVFRTLRDLQAEVEAQSDSALKTKILRKLGDSLRAIGELEKAGTALQESLAIAQALDHPSLVAATTLSLGNLEQGRFKVAFEQISSAAALRHAQQSLAYYQEAASLDDGVLGIQARLNVMQLLTNPIVAQWDTAIRFYPTVRDRLAELPPGRTAIYGYVGLAENLITVNTERDVIDPSWSEIGALLATAQAQAETLGDARAQSLVLGTLAHLYEQTDQYSDTVALAQQALALAKPIQADDLNYRWYWQLGRSYQAQGQTEPAIQAYTEAFNTLDTIRNNLVTTNPDVRFSFRDTIEPIYRELASLLLTTVPEFSMSANLKADTPQNQAYLRQARDVIEALQVAELDDYFQAPCTEVGRDRVSIDEAVDKTDTTAAVLYTAMLGDRLEVILKVPQQSDLVHYSAPAPRPRVDETFTQFRTALVTGANTFQYSRQVYDWLLKPAVDAGLVSPDRIKTLIFVLDGKLRLLPMAALHDGESWLAEKYAVSLILGLEVRDPQPLPAQENLQILAASLTDPPPSEASTYGPLPNVNKELDTIEATAAPTTLLRDEAFTAKALGRQLRESDYAVVHLATHGEFGRNRQNTFILAADDRVDLDTLGTLFRQIEAEDTSRLEMLVLSACKTATGSSREVLGIAGAAVRSGAKSAIATLWSVDDLSSLQFTEALYPQLGQPQASRAEALRQAQLSLLEQYPNNPRYWAPYVLVGSWR